MFVPKTVVFGKIITLVLRAVCHSLLCDMAKHGLLSDTKKLLHIMRRILVPFMLLFSIAFAGCAYDDSELVERIENLERNNNITSLTDQVAAIRESITYLESISASLDALAKHNESDIMELNYEFLRLESYVEERLSRMENHVAWLEDIIDGKIEDAITDGDIAADGEIDALRVWVEGTYATLDQHAAVTDAVSTLTAELSGIKEDLEAYKREVESSFDNVDDALGDITDDISQLTDSIATLTSAISDVQDDIADLQSSMQTWVNEQLANYYTISQVDAELQRVEQAIAAGDDALAAEIVDIFEQLKESIASGDEALATELESMQEDMNAMYDTIEQLKSDVNSEYKSAIESAITENNGVIDAKIESKLEELNARVDAELKSLDEHIDDLEQRISTLESDISNLNERMNDIEDALDRLRSLDLEFDLSENMACMPGASLEFGYRVINGDDDTKVESFGDGGWRTRVTATDASSGRIKVTAPKDDAEDGKIVVLATSGAGGTCMKSIYFDRGVIVDILDTYKVGYAANTLTVTLKTNLYYNVEISADAQSWVSNDATRAELREDTLSFTIAENPYEEERTAIVYLVSDLGDKLQSFEIVQHKAPSNAPIEFADQNVKRVCVEKFDTNGDGELSYREAAEVTEISGKSSQVSFFGDYTKQVTSFDELQYFVNLKTIGVDTFYYCENLKTITIPDGVTMIDSEAFGGCSSLTGIAIPDSVSTIESLAFAGCENIKTITIPDGVTTIAYGAFLDCISLTSVTIPDSVTTIVDYAFAGCTNLTSVTIPDSVTAIKFGAFMSCEGLASVTIGNSVATIGENAFFACVNLTSVTIPDSVTTIVDGAFSVCSRLKEFKGKFAEDNGRALIIDGALVAVAPLGIVGGTMV